MALPPSVIDGPDSVESVETTDFHFKIVKRHLTFQYAGQPPPIYASLVAVANSLGLAFIGTFNAILVVKSAHLENDNFTCKEIRLRNRPTFLTINCDDSFLAVGFSTQAGCAVTIYSLQSFVSEGNLSVVKDVRLPSPANANICDLIWNPTIPNLLSGCLTDGSVVMVEMKAASVDINSLPPAASARCLCWSPKGKQIVIGGEDGKLTQYKPDLKPAKALNAPPLFEGAVSVVNVLWVSNFQFAAFYRHRGKAEESPVFVIVNAPKNEPVTFINYDDITYGTPGFRCPQFYFHFIQPWNVILVGSANAVDLAVLHLNADGKTWQLWSVGDSSRAELPLTASQEETFPLGLSVDFSSQSPVLWPQTGNELPPVPRLLMLSHEGRLCLFNVIWVGGPAICTAAKTVVPDQFFNSPLQHSQAKVADQEKEPQVEIKPSLPAIPEQLSKSELPPPTPVSAFSSFEHQVPVQTHSPSLQIPTLKTQPQPVVIPKTQEYLFQPTQSSQPARSIENEPNISKVTPPPEADLPPSSSKPSPPLEAEHSGEEEVDNAVYDAAIADEVAAFDDEISAAISEGVSSHSTLPSESVFREPVKRLEQLLEFNTEVDETTVSQAEEVAELKQEILEQLARAEDARLVASRQVSRTHNRSEQLDPVTLRTLRDILSQRTFIENQLRQITDHLERQWENYQLSCRKNAKDRLETPLMEDVVKTIGVLGKLVTRLNGDVERLAKAVSQKTNPMAWSNRRYLPLEEEGSRSKELSKLAESLLELKLENTMKRDENKMMEEVLKAKRQHAGSTDLPPHQVTLLLDRFADAEVPEISHSLTFSEREAHKQEILTRIKKAAISLKHQEVETETRTGDVENKSAASYDVPKVGITVPTEKSAPPSFSVSSNENTIAVTKSYFVPSNAKTPITLTSQPQVGIFGSSTTVPSNFSSTLSNFSFSKGSESFPTSTQPVLNFSKTAAAPVTVISSQTASNPTVSAFASTLDLKFGGLPTAFGGSKSISFNQPPKFSEALSALNAPKNTTSFDNSSKLLNLSTSQGSTVVVSSKSTISSAPISQHSPADKSTVQADTTVVVDRPPSGIILVPSASSSELKAVSNTDSQTHTSVSFAPALSSSGSTFQLIPPANVKTNLATAETTFFGSKADSSLLSSSSTSPIAVSDTTPSLFSPTNLTTVSSTYPSTIGSSNTITTVVTSKPISYLPTTTATLPLFGAAVTNSQPSTVSAATTATSIFSTLTTTSTVSATFGSMVSTSSPTSSLVSSTTATSHIFGSPHNNSNSATLPTTSTSEAATTSAFGSQPVTTATPSLFGLKGATSSAPPLFGSQTSTTTAPSLFGPQTATTTAPSLFSSQIATTTSPLFGSTTKATSFASPVAATATAPSLFQSPAATTQSLFGSTPSTNVFSSPSTTSPSVFSGGSTPLFGAAATPVTTSSIFGGAVTTTAPNTGIFGSFSNFGATTTTTSIFSTPATTSSAFGTDLTQTTNLFGQILGGTSNPGSPSSNIFSPANSPKNSFETGGSIFGSSTSSPSVFSTGSNNLFGQSSFGVASTTTSSIFGQNVATTSSNSFFGQSICNPFGSGSSNQSPFNSPTATTQSAFGSTVFDSKPVFGQNVFGGGTGTSVFGGSASGGTTSIFGGTASSGNAFQSSPGPFSGGSSAVAQTGFNKSPGGFGSAPVFGGSPGASGFGAAPSFSGAPIFGDPPAFGSSPTKVFGSNNPQGNSTFGSLSNQNQNIGFGNVSQSQAFGSPPPFGSPQQQPSTTFGGNSFSSWR